MIVEIGQVSGVPSRGFEDGGPTQSPVGDEDGSWGFFVIEMNGSVGG